MADKKNNQINWTCAGTTQKRDFQRKLKWILWLLFMTRLLYNAMLLVMLLMRILVDEIHFHTIMGFSGRSYLQTHYIIDFPIYPKRIMGFHKSKSWIHLCIMNAWYQRIRLYNRKWIFIIFLSHNSFSLPSGVTTLLIWWDLCYISTVCNHVAVTLSFETKMVMKISTWQNSPTKKSNFVVTKVHLWVSFSDLITLSIYNFECRSRAMYYLPSKHLLLQYLISL